MTGLDDPDPRGTVELLVDGDVLIETEGEFGVSETFLEEVDRIRADVEALEEGAIDDRVADTVDGADERALVTEVGADDREFLAMYLALSDALPSAPAEIRIRTVPLLQQFRDSPPRAEGAPEAFVPVHGDRLRTVTRLFNRSIVYVWLDDCEPCDDVRSSFDEMLDGPPEGVELFAVYGPDYAEHLYEEYDVEGGPVTLFMVRDEVDSRLYGAKHPRVYENEIDQLRQSKR